MFKIITILGPTATGKTRLAALIGGEIISADSRQVYRGMDLGTGKDLAGFLVDGKKIPYHLIDIVEPGYEFNVFEFQQAFQEAMKVISSRGNLPLLCGGSGLYLDAVLRNYKLDKVPENKALRKELEEIPEDALIQKLKSHGPVHNTTDTESRHRLIRAIEIRAFEKKYPEAKQGTSMLKFLKSGLGLIYPVSRNVLNDTIMTGDFNFNVDQNPGDYDVIVMNWALGDVSLVDGFHLLPQSDTPNLLSISPVSAYQGTRVVLLIKAENTQFDKEGNTALVTLKLEGEDIYCKDVRVIDSVTLEAEYVFSYSNWTGLRDLEVKTPLDGKMILENSFSILSAEPNPSIVSVVPDSASQEDLLTVSVTATGTIFMQGTSNLTLSQEDFVIYALNETIVSDTVLSGEFNFLNTYPLGKYDVNIVNNYAWPSFSLPGGFTLKLFDFIEENASHALLTVYPNPTMDFLFVKRNVNTGGTFFLKIYDLKGSLLLEEIIENNDSGKRLDLSAFPKGTYLLKIVKDQKEQTEKFVIR